MKLFDRQKKWEINLYSYYDHAGIVRHLEDMARQGWQLENIGSQFWTYRRCPPTEMRYADLPAVQTDRAALRRGVLFQGQSV